MSKIVSFPLLNLSESCNQLKETQEVLEELSVVLKDHSHLWGSSPWS